MVKETKVSTFANGSCGPKSSHLASKGIGVGSSRRGDEGIYSLDTKLANLNLSPYTYREVLQTLELLLN